MSESKPYTETIIIIELFAAEIALMQWHSQYLGFLNHNTSGLVYKLMISFVVKINYRRTSAVPVTLNLYELQWQ